MPPEPTPAESRSVSADLRATAQRLRSEARVRLHMAKLARLDTAVRLMRLALGRLRR